MTRLPTIGFRERVKGDDRDKLKAELKRRYEKGRSIRSLADQMGRSYGFTRKLLVEAGVTLRQRGGNGNRKRRSRK